MSVKERNIITIGNFSGGEGDFPYTKFPPHFSAKMVNIHPTVSGGVAFAPGFTRLNFVAVSERLTSGHVYRKQDGTAIVLVAGEGKIYKRSSGELVPIKTGLNTSAKVRFITANDKCLMLNGVDAPMVYDGTSVTNLGGTPPATAFTGCYHKGRVWLIERTNKMIASHSALFNHADYTTAHDAGYYDFTKILKTGDELTDVQSYMDLLVFYFKNHIAIYSGNTPTDYGDFQIVQQVEGAGAITDTVQGVGVDHLLLSQIGCRSLRQIVQAGLDPETLISKNIQQRLPAAISGAGVAGPYGAATFQRLGWYMVLIGDTIWCYYPAVKAWFRYFADGINGIFSDSDGSAVYFCGNGFLYQFDVGYKADTVPLRREWDPAWFKFFRNGEYAYPKYLEIAATPSQAITMSVGCRYDLNGGTPDSFQQFTTDIAYTLMDEPVPDIWDNAFFMDPEDYVPTRVPLFGGGSSMQFNFTSEDEEGPFEINSLDISFVQGGKP